MSTDHDNSVDKVLEALRRAAPPEGMEQRIIQHLTQNPSPAHPPAHRWRNLLAGSAWTGAWWRGAITGAAAALLAVGLFFFATHHSLRTNSAPAQAPESAANRSPTAPAAISHSTFVSASATGAQAHPCVRQAILRVQPPTQLPSEQRLIAETHIDTAAPSHPAPALPLTSEERALVQFARTAPNPKAFAAPDPDTQTELEAQEADEFQKFFSPHQDPTAKENNKQN
jgi:hypothetical protein